MAKRKKGTQLPPGVHDILPEEQRYWERVRSVSSGLGFRRIDTPIFEFADLFMKSVGAASDIVEKQMYSFRTKGGDKLVLRPEETAPVARAYIVHGMHTLPQPVKLYYEGPMFRYESPQKGRYRQFHQYGVEVLGGESPIVEAQIIQLFFRMFQALKIKVLVEINSIGCKQCRPIYKKILSTYYRSRSRQVCADCRKRSGKNILRVLDCKEEKCQMIKQGAPPIVDHLCDACRNHFKMFLEYVEELDLPFVINHYLVRGLDYYSRTVFEFLPENIDKEEASRAQVALGGGGRYDYLVELLGGRPTPAAGAALGIERLIAYMKQSNIEIESKTKPRVFLIQLGEVAKKKSLKVFDEFIKNKISITESFGKESIDPQLSLANKLGVAYALILGHKEALEETIIIRDMKTGTQRTVPLSDVVKEVKKGLRG